MSAKISPIGQTVDEVIAEGAHKSKRYRDEMRRREPYVKVAHAIIMRRAELGISQEELARKIGTKGPAISRIESGQHPTSVRTLQRLAEALDLDLVLDLKRKPAGREKIAA